MSRVPASKDGAYTNSCNFPPERDAKYSGESDRASGAEARFGADAVRWTARTPMGIEEGGARTQTGATRAPQHL